MFIWKKKNPPRAELLLCLAAGDTNTETFFVENTFQEAVKFVCGLFEPPCRTVGWPLEGGQGIVLLQNRLDEKKKTFMKFTFCLWRHNWDQSEKQRQKTVSLFLSICLSSASLTMIPVSGPWGPSNCSLNLGACSCWPLTTCCWQIVPSVLVYYCTFSCFSQHNKCIKEQWNGATNKDSTTADRVDGWSTAREKFDPKSIMILHLCVCVCM